MKPERIEELVECCYISAASTGWNRMLDENHVRSALLTCAREAAEERDELLRECEVALQAANGFITNGVELGYIRMPDADCPDPAHKVPAAIANILAKLREAKP